MEKEYIYGVKLLNTGFLEKIKTSMPLNEDDFVIVEQTNEYDYDSLLFIGQVMIELSAGEFNHDFKIIHQIDLSDYMEKQRKKQRRERLQNKLTTEIQNCDPIEIAKILSKTNKTIKNLYEEYKRLC